MGGHLSRRLEIPPVKSARRLGEARARALRARAPPLAVHHIHRRDRLHHEPAQRVRARLCVRNNNACVCAIIMRRAREEEDVAVLLLLLLLFDAHHHRQRAGRVTRSCMRSPYAWAWLVSVLCV